MTNENIQTPAQLRRRRQRSRAGGQIYTPASWWGGGRAGLNQVTKEDADIRLSRDQAITAGKEMEEESEQRRQKKKKAGGVGGAGT